MIHICHVITDLNAGGAERMLVNLVTRFDRSRFSNEVISLIEPGIMAVELKAAGIPVTTLNMQRGRPSLSGMAALVRRLRQARPAILQSWLYHADLAATIASWSSPRASLIWNLRCSDLLDRPGAGRLNRVIRALAWMSALPQAVIVNSEKGQEFHVQCGYRPRRWALIPNGVDTTRFRARPEARRALRSELGIASEAPVVGLVARFHPMKDFDTFFQAAHQLSQTLPGVRFVLCGDGCDAGNDQLTSMIAGLGLTDRTRLLGTRSDMENVYPAFDTLALSSAYGEGFPNVLIEAMACGVPCVATDVGDSRAVVGESGLIVPARDPDALAEGWNTVLNAPGRFGDGARNRAVEHYGIDRVCQLYQTLYQEASRQGR